MSEISDDEKPKKEKIKRSKSKSKSKPNPKKEIISPNSISPSPKKIQNILCLYALVVKYILII